MQQSPNIYQGVYPSMYQNNLIQPQTAPVSNVPVAPVSQPAMPPVMPIYPTMQPAGQPMMNQQMQPMAQPVMNQPMASPVSPNAVSINIYSPQAFASPPNNTQNFYPMYGQNMMPGYMMYPNNYNNLMTPQPQTKMQALDETNLKEKTPAEGADNKTSKKDKKKKTITPLTDEYVASLENYLNNQNPKVRLIGAKNLMERFKEDENRKDNPCLIPLLNKCLKDPNAAVRFLGLTTLQLGYSVGNEETVAILKQITENTTNKLSEDYTLALEALLKMSAPEEQTIYVDKEPEDYKAEAKKEESSS